MKLDRGSTDQLMALAAHRYCLGRQSYIVGACIAWVRQTWDQFEPNTQTVMLRDTIEELAAGNVGSPTIDAPKWRKLCAWMIEKMTPEQTAAACRQIKHREDALALYEELMREKNR